MKKTRYIFLIVGIAILAFLLDRVGLQETVDYLIQLGWKFWILVSIFLFNNIFLTYAWVVLITVPVSAKSFYKFILARIAGDSTSSLNALGAAAGEPLKALYIRDLVPFRTGLASVVLDRTIHFIGNLLIILTGIIVAMFILNLPVILTSCMLLAVLSGIWLLFLLVKKQKNGFFEYIISKIPKNISKRFITEARLEKVQTLDKEIGYIFNSRDNLHHFYISLAIHYFSVMISGALEIYFIIIFIEPTAGFSLVHGLFVYIFGFILTSAMFFMPANVGTSEGSYTIALKFLGYNEYLALGVATGIIRRLRTIVWAGIGFGILSFAGLTSKTSSEDSGEKS